jgi:integrase
VKPAGSPVLTVAQVFALADAMPDQDALVFTGVQGRALRRGTWSQWVKWTEIVTKLGLAGLHFHEVRHAGNIWASKAGMSTKDLMARRGHDDMRAALIQQRATATPVGSSLTACQLVDEHRGRRTAPDGEGDEVA